MQTLPFLTTARECDQRKSLWDASLLAGLDLLVRHMIQYSLDNSEKLNLEFPETFHIPARKQRENILPGELVKLIFRISFDEEEHVERMWVIVKERKDNGYIGELDNDPYCTNELRSGDQLFFIQNTSSKYMKTSLKPNPAFKRDATKALRPLTLR